MSTISYNKFIFSDEKTYRVKRHLLFWAGCATYFGLVRGLNPRTVLDNGNVPNLFISIAQAFLTLLPQTILVYPLLYFILPRYAFNKKYGKALFLFIILVVIMISINAGLLMTIPW